LTSLGLFFTFLAILLGLASVKQDPQVMGKIVGVEELVYNLSGKFLTSIIALGFSILYTLLQDFLKVSVVGAFNELRRKINQIFPFLTVQSLIQESNRMVSEVANFVRDLGQKVAENLSDGVTRSLAPHLKKFEEAVENLRKEKESSLGEIVNQLRQAITEMIAEFKGSLFASTHSSFIDFSESVRKFAKELESISQTYQQSNKWILESGNYLRQVAETVCSSIDNTLVQQLEALNKGVSGLLSNLETEFSTLLHDITTSLAQSSRGATDSITRVVDISNSLQETALKQLDEAVSRNTQILRSFQEASEGHLRSLEAFQELHQKMHKFNESLNVSYQRLTNIAEKLESSINNLHHVASKFADSSATVEQMLKVQESLFKRIEALSAELGNSISTLLTSFGTTVDNYAKSIRETTGGVLGEFKTALEKASSVFSQNVDNLADVIEDFKNSVTSYGNDRTT
ncbi:MAG: hypothetical protein NZT61_07760, partial [Deltaproteobacteria bacterium]|nr:hypothetical protein [Deltaproteobacteria bacterium]